jgi:cysteine desulfurase
MADPIYLDHNATTPVLPEVLEAMLPYLRQHFGNPSSGHVFGQRSRRAVEDARGQVASLLDCRADEILFTSGGTESNNLAVRGLAPGARHHVVTSTIEHPAIERPCRLLAEQGATISWIPVDADGRLRLDALDAELRDDTGLVTIIHANNELGTIQPIAEIAALAHARGAFVHTDAAQSVGKIPTLVSALGVDLLSVAGHKLYAPKGVGALYVRDGTPLRPVVRGAGHERGLRPGTENVASIVGLGAACELARRSLDVEACRVQQLRDRLWLRLRREIPELVVNGHAEYRLPNTLSVRFPRVRASAVLAAAPGVAASTGSACHEGGEAPSSVLLAIGLDPDRALETVRLSLGRMTTLIEVDHAADELARAHHALARQG